MQRISFLLILVFISCNLMAQPVTLRPIAYQVPEMSKVRVVENIEYRKVNDTSLKLDIYYPPGFDKKKNLPVVIFNNGVGSMDLLKWRVYQDWAKLIAANGMIAVNHQGRPSRSTVMDDCIAVLDYLRAHARELNIDADKMGIWTCSANSRVGTMLALRPGRPYIRTLVTYYGAFDSIGQLRQDVPTLVVRAGLDAQGLNMGIENFMQDAMKQDIRVELINYLEGIHAFDIYDKSDESISIIKRTVEFLKKHLTQPIAASDERILTNRNFMWMMNSGQSNEAIAAFRKAVVKNRADTAFQPFYNAVIREDVLNQNAYWLLRNGKQPEALQTFKLMVETYPASANAHDGLADAYEALGNKAEALSNAEKSLQLLENDRNTNEQTKAAIKRSAEDKIKRLKS
jgi:tetratricopeptide (TPR) repeat protein